MNIFKENNIMDHTKKHNGVKILRINNSKESSIDSDTWRNPGAVFYNTLIHSKGNSDMDYKDFLSEGYLIAPIHKIKNSNHECTPYSNSGCKFPHHSIKGNELVVNKAGLQAAYSRVKQMGLFKGDIKNHLERHYKELGMYEDSSMVVDKKIQENFDYIDKYIMENKNNVDELFSNNINESKEDNNEANGKKRKELYMEFITYAKSIHKSNAFGSVFDKDAFKETYKIVPKELRYFYRLSNPLTCVLENTLTIFSLEDVKKINDEFDNDEFFIIGGNKDELIIAFDKSDKSIKSITINDDEIKQNKTLSKSFDLYIESLIGKSIL